MKNIQNTIFVGVETVVKDLGISKPKAYKIIKEFSGDIQVESKEGEGCAFIITLPVPQTDKRLLEAK